MRKFISAASIGQFREVVASVNRSANFVALDESGVAIYDPALQKPVIKFTATIKLHGTFSSVCYNSVSGVWFQSKNEIITPLKDNAGFAFYAESKKEVFINLIKELANQAGINLFENTISLGSEWVGTGIQRGVSISLIERSAFIFAHAKVVPFDSEKSSYWISTNGLDSVVDKIYNLSNFKTYTLEVDFNNPQLSQKEIIEITACVEAECPVAKRFGFSGVGEGVVFTHLNKEGGRLVFKSKGEKHSTSKVKVLKRVDSEKINKIIQVAELVTPSWRLEQMLNETFDTLNGGVIDRKGLVDYLRAVINDVIKEDSDIISAAGLELKSVNKYISQRARNFFLDWERADLGL